jgi:hypothetical protein
MSLQYFEKTYPFNKTSLHLLYRNIAMVCAKTLCVICVIYFFQCNKFDEKWHARARHECERFDENDVLKNVLHFTPIFSKP